MGEKTECYKCLVCEKDKRSVRWAYGACDRCGKFIKDYINSGKIKRVFSMPEENIQLVMKGLGVKRERARFLLGMKEEEKNGT